MFFLPGTVQAEQTLLNQTLNVILCSFPFKNLTTFKPLDNHPSNNTEWRSGSSVDWRTYQPIKCLRSVLGGNNGLFLTNENAPSEVSVQWEASSQLTPSRISCTQASSWDRRESLWIQNSCEFIPHLPTDLFTKVCRVLFDHFPSGKGCKRLAWLKSVNTSCALEITCLLVKAYALISFAIKSLERTSYVHLVCDLIYISVCANELAQ